jgi:dihydrofolate synthase/folylpolyglutamate synthase
MMHDPVTHDQEAAHRFLVDRIDYERMTAMPNSEEAFKLDRMAELLRRLGDPQRAMRIVHVAGTKGKGSTAAMMAAILAAAGFRTGLFTSPHLERVEERIAINGEPCSPAEFAEAVQQLRPAVEAMDRPSAVTRATDASPQTVMALSALSNQELANTDLPGNVAAATVQSGPTYFEVLTAAALVLFVRRKVQVAVLEVGLGGRLDSTNVCLPEIALITSISVDHVKQLGHTLTAIATEKSGIIKPGVPVVSGVVDAEPAAVVRQAARKNGCRLWELGADFDFDYEPPRHLERAPSLGRLDFRLLHGTAAQNGGGAGQAEKPDVPGSINHVALALLGRHQAANAAVAAAAVEQLRHAGWRISEAAIRQGLADVRWPARIEIIARRPTVVLDAAHNAASIDALLDVLSESFQVRRRLLVFATTQDKDLGGMLTRLQGRFDEVVFSRYVSNPRGVPPQELQALADEIAAGCGGRFTTTQRELPPPASATEHVPSAAGGVRIASTPAEAWDMVRCLAGEDDLICITGSFFFAAEMRRQVGRT